VIVDLGVTRRSDVVQAIGPGTGRWWVRLTTGQLWVWSRWEEARTSVRTKTDYGVMWGPVAAPVPEWIDRRSPNPVLAGSVHPSRITCALDYHGLDGPEVDEAIGVHNALDTTVDSWEAGVAVPTASELLRLATLTGFPPAWFHQGPMPRVEGWICGRGRGERFESIPGVGKD
jgi:hypothetical protein